MIDETVLAETGRILAEGGPGSGRKKIAKRRELSVPERHQLSIARKTLRMPDAMVGVMGGPNKEQARSFIRRLGKVVKEAQEAVTCG